MGIDVVLIGAAMFFCGVSIGAGVGYRARMSLAARVTLLSAWLVGIEKFAFQHEQEDCLLSQQILLFSSETRDELNRLAS